MNDKPKHIEVKKTLLEAIGNSRKENELNLRGGFIGWGILSGVLPDYEIRTLLREDFATDILSDTELESLQEYISSFLRKTYAILVLVDRGECIWKIHGYRENNKALSDRILFDEPFQQPSYSKSEGFAWKTDDLQEVRDLLFEKQWLIPPKLVNSVHQRFPPEKFIFPFVKKPVRTGHGSFGHVFEIEIAEGHLDFPAGFDKNTKLVVKRIKESPRRKLDADRLEKEAKTLRARKHKNIMPLLASFEAGDFEDRDRRGTDKYLYIVMPLAQGNLDDWIGTKPSNFSDDRSDRETYISKLALDIASGLTCIHGMDENSRIAFHHDLKPENIVCYREAEDDIWKICDFGTANLKNVQEEGSSTSFLVGTDKYAPLEYHKKKRRGRASDIWSLGCIFLELATIWRHGWNTENGLAVLDGRIRPANDGTGNSQEDKVGYCWNLDEVRKWIVALGNDGDNTHRYGVFLALIQEMLVEDSEMRVFAFEVEIDLFAYHVTKPSEITIQKRFMEIVQPSDTYSNGLARPHNPYLREKRQRRRDWMLKILQKKNWSDSIPSTTSQANRMSYRSEDCFSNLKMLENRLEIYGFVEEVKWIESTFAETASLGLYGVHGVGKSHLARHYIHQFQITLNLEERRHTFWIDANSRSSLESSFAEISWTIGNKPPVDVKNWLEDETNGPWIMVVDDIGSEQLAKEIKSLIPTSKSGQVLATARKRDFLVEFGIKESREVKPPGPEYSLKLFHLYLKEEYWDENLEGTKELLEKLWLPLVIKIAALYMNKMQKSSKRMQQDLESFNFKQITEFSTVQHLAFMDYFLEPLTYIENGIMKVQPELKLLCFMACLSNKKVGLKLIQTNYKNHAKLDGMLSSLVNCAFIERVNYDEFRMHKFIQDGVIEWILRRRGEANLFKLLNTVMGALYQRYKIKMVENQPEEGSLPLQRSWYGLKVPFKEHFDRFVEFVRTTAKANLKEFRLHKKALRAIDIFSQALIDEGSPSRAIEVLDFALNHLQEQGVTKAADSGSGAHMTSDVKGERMKTKLKRILADAYSRKGGAEDYDYARTLLVDQLQLLRKIQSEPGTNRSSAKQAMLIWDVQLDLVQLDWKFNRLPSAQKGLKSLKFLDVKKGQSRIQPRNPKQLDFLHNVNKKVQKNARHIVVRYKRFEGLLLLAAGRHLIASTGVVFASTQARKKWKDAKATLSTAVEVLEQWLPEEEEYLMKIESNIAEVKLELGAVLKAHEAEEILKEAETVLERHTQTLIEKQSEYLMWEAKRKLAEVRIELKKTKLYQVEIEELKRLMENYKTRYGKMSTETLGCVRVLATAYIKQGQTDEAKQLWNEYNPSRAKKKLLQHRNK